MEMRNKTVQLFFSECIGTALLLMIGLSVVIFIWGDGSVIAPLIPSVGLRRLVTGFFFGCTGCLVTISPVGKVSGAHINPAVSIAFWMRGKMKFSMMTGYVFSQMLGAVLGCIPLLLWGRQGKSVEYGNTIPLANNYGAAFIGETVTTMLLIIVIFVFVGSKKLRHYTPYTMPFLYALMVWAETALSGCSTNPARSFGPAVVSRIFTGYWLYVAGPITGVVLTAGIFRLLRLHTYYQITAARMSYHDHSLPVK